jgi:hypothetical protein
MAKRDAKSVLTERARPLAHTEAMVVGYYDLRTAGLTPGAIRTLERHGRLSPCRVYRNQQARLYYALDEALRVFDGPVLTAPRWTKAERQYLQDNVGTMTTAEMAHELGRSISSVDDKVGRMFGTVRRGARARGLLTIRDLAKLLGTHFGTVQSWAQHSGMPVSACGKGSPRFVDLRQVRAWLQNRWLIAVNLRPGALARIGLALDGGAVVQRAPQTVAQLEESAA